MDGLNQRLLKEIAVGAAKDARTLRPLAVGTFRKRFPISIGGRAPVFLQEAFERQRLAGRFQLGSKFIHNSCVFNLFALSGRE